MMSEFLVGFLAIVQPAYLSFSFIVKSAFHSDRVWFLTSYGYPIDIECRNAAIILEGFTDLLVAVDMGSAVSWFYSAYYSVDQWVTSTWYTLVAEEQQHPVILAIAVAIVLCLFISLLCSLCSCCWALCCHRPKYPGYQPIYANEKHNYAAIPSSNHPPYNPNAPSTSKGYIHPIEV